MTIIEQELIETIRNHPTPDTALKVAVEIISDFLKQLESSEEQAAASQREPA